MSDITWTKGTPTFTDPIEWWRTRLNQEEQPFIVAVEVAPDGRRIVSFPGLPDQLAVVDLPAGALWGGRIDMGDGTLSAPVLPPGWEIDPDCEPTPTGEQWTADTWEARWTPERCVPPPYPRHDHCPWEQEFLCADGVPVWRWRRGSWCRSEPDDTGKLYTDVLTPVGPLIPIRRVRS